ncbi:MAG: hypothetical protein HYZ71_14535 [Deltaproteobacteria bacterium]|nr:hypothetical protein [Deltaproteobacteria bacterium]
MRLGLIAILFLVGCSRLYTGHTSTDTTPDYMSDHDAEKFVGHCHDSLRRSSTQTLSPRVVEDGPYRWATIPYSIEANDRGFHLAGGITLDLGQIPPNQHIYYWARLQNIRQCVRDFYGRHDIFLNLTFFRSGEQGGVGSSSPGYVVVRKMGYRIQTFNMANWAFGMDGVELNDELLCTVFSHELGHMLGLRDEYFDSAVTHRRMGADDSVMKQCQVSPSQARLYPHHLRTIVKNACEEHHAEVPAILGGGGFTPPF